MFKRTCDLWTMALGATSSDFFFFLDTAYTCKVLNYYHYYYLYIYIFFVFIYIYFLYLYIYIYIFIYMTHGNSCVSL